MQIVLFRYTLIMNVFKFEFEFTTYYRLLPAIENIFKTQLLIDKYGPNQIKKIFNTFLFHYLWTQELGAVKKIELFLHLNDF